MTGLLDAARRDAAARDAEARREAERWRRERERATARAGDFLEGFFGFRLPAPRLRDARGEYPSLGAPWAWELQADGFDLVVTLSGHEAWAIFARDGHGPRAAGTWVASRELRRLGRPAELLDGPAAEDPLAPLREAESAAQAAALRAA